MASNNTIKTRIQLKSDTEDNWKKSVLVSEGGTKTSGTSFVPLAGELIVYTADTTHPFSRLKVGDGSTNVVNLHFIDSGTLNGKETEIVKKATFTAFPSPGLSTCLYVDESTNKVYHYTTTHGYTLLNDFEFSITTASLDDLITFSRGRMTQGSIENNALKIVNGSTPSLSVLPQTVVTSITKGVLS